MIEITMAQLRSEGFQKTVDKLMSCTDLDFVDSYAISRIGKKVKSETEESQIEFVKLVKRFANIEEGTGKFEVPEEKAHDWKTNVQQFMDTKVIIDRRPLTVAQLKKVGLSPSELTHIESLVDLSEMEAQNG